MRLEFAGAFAAGGGEAAAWTCGVCATVNQHGPTCSLCSRDRHPDWLRIGDAGSGQVRGCVGVLQRARVADTAATQQLVLVLGAYVLYRFHGLQFPAVVTAIDAIQKSVTVVVMVLKAGADNPSRSQGLPTFKEAVVSKGDVRATLAPSPSLTDDVSATATARLREFAICKECRGIFHVCPTSLSAPNEDSQAALHGEESKLEALLKRRQELLLAKQYDQVLLCTEEIKAQKRVVQVARRGQEHLSQLSCPLCGVVT